MDLKTKESGGSKTQYGLALSPDFWPPRSLSGHVQCLLCPKEGNMWPLDLFLKQGLAPLCSCHDCYVKASTGDKAWLSCFCCYFHFGEQTGGWLWISRLEPIYLLSQVSILRSSSCTCQKSESAFGPLPPFRWEACSTCNKIFRWEACSTCNNYWACALEPVSHSYWAHVPQLLKPVCLEPMLCNKRSHCNEKPTHCNEDPTQPKINK